MKATRFSEKEPGETITLEFDFSKWCSSISLASVDVRQVSPTTVDPDLATIKEGSPTIIGGKVQQQVKAGLNLYDYAVECTVDTAETAPQRFILVGVLPVRKYRE